MFIEYFIFIAKKKSFLITLDLERATGAMFVMWQFTADTPIWVYILVTSMAGLGMGAIPTVNTVVAQAVVPKNLLGVAVGALFFFQMVGIAVAPSIMGLVQSTSPDLERGLQLVLLTNAIALTLSLLIIVVSPEIPLDSE